MSTKPQVDFDALARQHGGTTAIDFTKYEQANTPKIDFSKYESAPETQEKPGFLTRLGQSVGLPTSQSELDEMAKREQQIPTWQRLLPHNPGQPLSAGRSIANTVLGPVTQAYDMATGYGKHTVEGFKDARAESIQADKDLAAGHITAAQAQAIKNFASNKGLVNAVPFIGPAINTAGEDVTTGNYRGAAGGLTGVIGQVAAPELIKRGAPLVGRAGEAISEVAPDLAAKAKAVGKLLPREITGKIPVAGRIDSLRTPTFGDYWDAIVRTKADPQQTLFAKTPKLGDAPLSTTPIQDAIEKRTPAGADLRSKFDAMTPQEKTDALVKYHTDARTNTKTGLPNKLAFDEAVQANPGKVVAMSDVDGLKHFNDNVSYEAGDQLLKAKAEAMKEAGIDAFHDKGDEFMGMGNSRAELEFKYAKAREILRNKEFEITQKDGTVSVVKGADFSYGTGKDAVSAEQGLKAHKAAREASGDRTRGEFRGTVTDRPQENQVNQASTEQNERPLNLTDSGNPQKSNLKKNLRDLATANPALVEKYKKQFSK